MLNRLILIVVAGSLHIAQTSAADINPEALLGKWCYSHVEVGGETDKENIPYEFLPNGEFTFKNSSTASSTRVANYKLEGNKLDIGGLAPGGLEIVELTDETIVAKGMFSSMRHFNRGDCN